MTPETNHTKQPRRSWWGIAGDVFLNTLAVGGIICIALVACAFVFNITLIMFKTGSMSPAIPAGSLAVVRAVPADSVGVGDVVTVDREGMLPVTHRVVATETIEESGITEVRTVLWSMPGLARVIVYFSNPYVLGLITLSMAGLVVAVFWPREEKGSDSLEESQTRS